jgi:hypothetical protein
MGVDRSTVVRLERADTDPQPWHRPRLARALEVSVDELAGLLGDVGEHSPRSRHVAEAHMAGFLAEPAASGAEDLGA